MNKTHIQYGAAILAAPLFVLFYNYIFQHQSVDIERLFSDTNSLFFLIVFYPVIEELAFRGVIQEYIASKTEQYPSIFFLTVANIMTSVLFVLIHFVHHTPVWALLVFVPSLIFGYFKDQYNNIVPSIFLHMFYNFCSVFMIIS
ncbi:JDVT-CTERM system glutamic-type intramembrane protease [Sulfurovum sp. XGS-02]|uniref:JDVT-CTERM system glutamic-type intramembrane protease MrtJ n=1 Tax=Sulfurovum sp. XGS-02 TaxID=2925411 RepID=UPI00204E489C|nr:JDVT-CTERM system glutamic-type intramembrane protease [Sulfurovum sp. XGS-02]UPT76566.1 JDVT-CTERM system glutamic-type intramembrane protease [Sulfurovum sp. XGS-02]